MIDSSIFRVKVDLGQFYSDHKSKAYVSVNCQWKNVRQFHRHITEIFDVKKFVLLTNDGVYLPAKEHIGIIQSGDVIHVMPKHDDNESVVSATSETLATLTERNVNKHLYANDGQTFKIPSSVSPSIEIISSKKSNIPVGDDECIESVGTNDTGDSTGSKRKRVRHRKKKKNPMENDENQMNLPNVKGASGGILKRDVSAKKTFDKPLPKSNTHVSARAAESDNHGDDINLQSNEISPKDVNSSGQSDEYLMLDYQKQMAKKEYTRSQLIELGNSARGQSAGMAKIPINCAQEKKLMRFTALNILDTLTEKVVTGEGEPKLNDDFWSKATTNDQNVNPVDMMPRHSFEFDYQSALAEAAMDDRFEQPFSRNAKVDRWLHSGQSPSEYAHVNADLAARQIDLYAKNTLDELKPNETASIVTDVSAKSAIRSKLLDKTAKVKKTLRNLTQNNN